MEELKALLKGLVIIVLAAATFPYWLPVLFYVWMAIVVLCLAFGGAVKVLEWMGKL